MHLALVPQTLFYLARAAQTGLKTRAGGAAGKSMNCFFRPHLQLEFFLIVLHLAAIPNSFT